ncbi:MAG TPA: ATP-binding cassette domain-containing protein [Vicinamibacteria bacterium]|jgi:phospholipid/cholesterol/gamma-HCH transport system ATP-binding protein
MIEYRNLYKSYDVPVLLGANLTVATGEVVAIVGASGCGKSVFLKTTIGLVVPDRGDVRIDGESVFRSPRAAVDRMLRKIGYVFQYSALFDSMDVRSNVAYGLRDEVARDLGPREVERRVVRAIEEVNLGRRILGKLPAELSGGMRKRVGLARAIVGRPEILLFDEPVTGLDPVNAASVQRLIGSIARGLGATSIIVTHDIRGALEMSDRIGLLHEGRFRFAGTPAEFRASGDRVVQAFADRRAAAVLASEMASA